MCLKGREADSLLEFMLFEAFILLYKPHVPPAQGRGMFSVLGEARRRTSRETTVEDALQGSMWCAQPMGSELACSWISEAWQNKG